MSRSRALNGGFTPVIPLTTPVSLRSDFRSASRTVLLISQLFVRAFRFTAPLPDTRARCEELVRPGRTATPPTPCPLTESPADPHPPDVRVADISFAAAALVLTPLSQRVPFVPRNQEHCYDDQ